MKNTYQKCVWCDGSVQNYEGPEDRLDWHRWRCRKCYSYGYIKNPNTAELSTIYQSAFNDSSSEGDFAIGSTSFDISNSLLNAVGWNKRNSKCLDYGGGKGYFAKALVNRGCNNITVYEPHGDNPNIKSVKWLNNIDSIQHELFDWIFMIEVVEHMLDPEYELKMIKEHLAPGGKLVITTPNAKGWRALKDGFKWREAQNATHINLFSTDALIKCLQNAGYKKIKRVLRPVKYNVSGLKGLFLSVTQMIGIDGGIRLVVKKD